MPQNQLMQAIHAQVQSYAVSFIPSVIDQWNKLLVAILNIDDITY